MFLSKQTNKKLEKRALHTVIKAEESAFVLKKFAA